MTDRADELVEMIRDDLQRTGSGIGAAYTTAATELDVRRALRLAFREIATAAPHPCSEGRHVVSPTARGWTNCANCYRPVFVEARS